MTILDANEAPQFDLTGATITGLAARSRGAAELTTYRVRLDPHSALPSHRHDHEEVFTVILGSATAVLDGEEHPTGRWDTVIVPAGAWHHVQTGDDPVDLIAAVPLGTTFTTPDGQERIAPWAT